MMKKNFISRGFNQINMVLNCTYS